MLISLKTPSNTTFLAHQRILSLIIMASMALVVATILKVPMANSYEVSIYDAYPWFFWVAIAVSVFACLVLLILRAISSRSTHESVYSYPALFLMTAVAVSVPLIRGYFLYGRADVLTQVGWTNDILRSGYVSLSDSYPIDHIVAASISLTTGLKVETLTMVVPQIFTFVYILFSFVMIKQMFSKRSDVVITFAFFAILLFNSANTQVVSYVLFAPYPQSFFLLTAIIYLFLKMSRCERRASYAIPIVALVILTIAFHPLTSLMLICFLGILSVLDHTFFKGTNKSQFRRTNPERFLLLALIAFIMWRSYMFLVARSIGSIYDWLAFGTGKSEYDIYSGLVSFARPSLTELVLLIFLVYGPFIILTLLMTLSILFSRRINSGIDPYVRSLSIAGFAAFSAMAFFAFVSPFIVPFGRIYALSIIFILMMVPSYLQAYGIRASRAEDRPSLRKRSRELVIALLILVLVCCSISTLYLSPIVKYENPQVASSEMKGMSWFFQNRIDQVPILSLGIDVGRFYDGLYGRSSGIAFAVYDRTSIPLDHFGYANHTYLGDSYGETSYLTLSDAGRLFYPSVYPEYQDLWRFTNEDFLRLNEDSTVQSVLDNGNIELYIVIPS